MNYLAMQVGDIVMLVVWAIVIIATLIIEFETTNLVSIWFSAGGIAGMFAAIIKLDPWIQIIIFTVVSVLFLIATRPFVKKISENQTIATNVDKLIGMTGIVTKQISNEEKGEIKVDFKNWSAITRQNKVFKEGEKVVIVDIVGNKMIIEEIKEINLN